MKTYSVLEEHPTHFVVSDGTGAPFRVAKKGLSPALLGRIQSFARGGEVQREGGGAALWDAASTLDGLPLEPLAATAGTNAVDALPLEPLPLEPQGGSDAVSALPLEPLASAALASPDAILAAGGAGARMVPATEMEALGPGAAVPASGEIAPSPTARRPLTSNDFFRELFDKAGAPSGRLYATPGGGGLVASPPLQTPEPSESSAQNLRRPLLSLEAPQPAAPAPAPAPAAASPGAALPRGAGTSAIDRGVKEQLAGLKAGADAATAFAGAQTGALDALAKAQEAARKAFSDARATNLHQQNLLRDDILKARIDPNRLFGEGVTGRKVLAAVSLFLGGLGAGLARGPNFALQIVQSAIDRDIEAQRAELGKRRSLLDFYVQQGRELVDAHKLAKADLLDIASAQIQKAAAQYSGAKGTADAQQAAGALQTQAAQLRDEAAARAIELRYRPQIMEAEIALRHAQAGQAIAAQRQAVEKGEMSRAAQLAEAALLTGREVPVDVLPLLPKDTRESLVQLPGGRFARAHDPEAARKVRAAQEASAEMRSLIDQMRALRQQHPGGKMVSDAASKQAQQLAEMAKIVLNKAGGLGALDKGSIEILNNLVPDPLAFFTTDKRVNAQLDTLTRRVQDAVRESMNANLIRPQQTAVTPLDPAARAQR